MFCDVFDSSNEKNEIKKAYMNFTNSLGIQLTSDSLKLGMFESTREIFAKTP